MSSSRIVLVVALVFAVIAASSIVMLKRSIKPLPVAVSTIGSPKLATYAWLLGNGDPLAPGGIVDTAAVRTLARYDVVIIDPYRYGANAAALRLLRSEMSKRPGTTLLTIVGTSKFFVCGEGWFFGEPIYGCDTTQIAYSRARAVQHFDGLLYGKSGPYLGGGWIDFTRPGLPEALADTAAAWMTDGFAGVFSDESCLGILWTQNYGDVIDHRRSGFATLTAWDSAYRVGVERYFARLRLKLGHDLVVMPWTQGKGRLIVGNCGPLGSRTANGWLRENFPYQNGGTWESNMFGHPGVPEDVGYLGDDTAYVAPRLNLLSAWARNGDPYDPYNQRRARFVIANAEMGGGVGALTWSQGDPARGYSSKFWWDEYAVDSKGHATDDPAAIHWLGRPNGPAYADTAAGGVPITLARYAAISDSLERLGRPAPRLRLVRRDFDNGAILVNHGQASIKISGMYGYRRILGRLSINVNNGSMADGSIVAAEDAVFLQKMR